MSAHWSLAVAVAAANQEPVSVSMSSVSSPSERQISSNASSDGQETGSQKLESDYTVHTLFLEIILEKDGTAFHLKTSLNLHSLHTDRLVSPFSVGPKSVSCVKYLEEINLK